MHFVKDSRVKGVLLPDSENARRPLPQYGSSKPDLLSIAGIDDVP